MNGPHTPVFARNNRWTQVIERLAAQNASEGKPAGRMLEQMENATPVISARRAGVDKRGIAKGRDFRPDPEDPSIALRAEARAAAMGLNYGGGSNDDDLPGDIGHVASDPTDAEIDQMLAAARGQVPGASVGGEGAAAPGLPVVAPAAAGRPVTLPRGVAAPQMGLAGPRTMPNFANVEGFDLTRKVAVVDGMEFQLADDDVVAMKKFAIQVVLDNVTFQLAQALITLGIPADMAKATADKMRETAAGATGGDSAATGGVTAQAVHQVPAGQTAGGVLPGPAGAGHADTTVPAVHHGVQQEPSAAGSQPAVQLDRQGSGEQPAVLGGEGRPADDTDYLLVDGGDSPA